MSRLKELHCIIKEYSLYNLATIKPSKISLFSGALFFLYASLLLFFNYVDVYGNHFFTSGKLVIIYNFYRLIFILALSWFFYIVGQVTLELFTRNSGKPPLTLDNTIAAFIAGVGISHIILFIVGLSGNYSRSLLAIITLILLVLSLPRLDSMIRFVCTEKIKINYLGLLILAGPLTLFLLTKGLYPAGGHDYYNHYFHFYRRVVESGSIMPNEVWYHFYYSKGAALFFLSMLLTDPLGPQLGSVTMIFAETAIVFSIINRSATVKLLPWIGASLYLLLLIYTPGPLENMRHGGWGDLEKPHEPGAILFLAILWITIQLKGTKNWKFWNITQGLVVSALVLISPAMSVLSATYLGIMSIFFLFKKNYMAAATTLLGSIIAGTCLAILLVINYLLTGLPDDQSLFVFWPIINFDTLKNWGVLFEVYILHNAKTGLIANSVPLTQDMLFKLLPYLRLDVWWLLLTLVIGMFAILLPMKKWRQAMYKNLDKSSLAVIGGFLLFIAVISLFIGRDQPISFYRFTSFTYGPMLCLCMILMCAVLRNWIIAIGGTIIAVIAVTYLLTTPRIFLTKYQSINDAVTVVAGQYDENKILKVIKNALKFSRGKFSIADAYQNQDGWPGRMPWGGIYPPTISIWKLLPRNTPIWSMHIHSYCMLPSCKMEGFMSFRLSPHALTIYYGEPLQAKKWLQEENHNYFFISNSLQLTDPLPLSKLFSPVNIGKYLGVVWTDGDNTLLTWKEQSSMPLNSEWLEKYKQQVNKSIAVNSYPYEELREVLDNAARNSRVQEQSIPWFHAGWH